MRRYIFIIIVIVGGKLCAQDLILTKGNRVLESHVEKITQDSITFVHCTDSASDLKAMPLEEIQGIQFKDRLEFTFTDVYLNKEIYKIRRVKKSGFHIGLTSFFGTGEGYYYSEKIKDDYDYEDNKHSNVFVFTEELHLKYFINYVLSLTSGIGYNTSRYEVSNLNKNSFQGQYAINTIQIPLRISFTPGSVFGLIFENGISLRIPFSANCTESYRDEAYNWHGERRSFMDDIDRISVYLEMMVGFHATIKKKFIVQLGVMQKARISDDNARTATNGYFNYGLKLSVNYRLSQTENK